MVKEINNKFNVLEIIISFVIGSIISLIIHIRKTYIAENKFNGQTDFSFGFTIEMTKTFYNNIFTSMKFFIIFPPLWLVLLVYIIVVYKLIKSDNVFFIKNRFLLLVIVFTLLHITIDKTLSLLIM